MSKKKFVATGGVLLEILLDGGLGVKICLNQLPDLPEYLWYALARRVW